jgi:membrane protein DedA with SNARE-associated domain
MTSYFSSLVDFVHAHSQYTSIAIFLLALSEAIPVVGTVVPGSTLIIGLSALATGTMLIRGYFSLPRLQGRLLETDCRTG